MDETQSIDAHLNVSESTVVSPESEGVWTLVCDAVCGVCGETFVTESGPHDILEPSGVGGKSMFVKAGVPCIVVVVAWMLRRKWRCLGKQRRDFRECETDEGEKVRESEREENEERNEGEEVEESREEEGREEEAEPQEASDESGSQSPNSVSPSFTDRN